MYHHLLLKYDTTDGWWKRGEELLGRQNSYHVFCGGGCASSSLSEGSLMSESVDTPARSSAVMTLRFDTGEAFPFTGEAFPFFGDAAAAALGEDLAFFQVAKQEKVQFK